jgi:hypothetical protein
LDAGELIGVDPSQPWYAAVAPDLPLLGRPDPRSELSRLAALRGVTTAAGAAIRFVAADDAPGGRTYEEHIAATGRVPTRLNPHDLFNALMWLAMPRTKSRLNALQAATIERNGVGARRGPLRDAATVFDENGALLVTMDISLAALLREHCWHEAFVDRRADWSLVSVICFGHALLEKLAAPYKAITAHALVIELRPCSSLKEADEAASATIDECFSTAVLLPLPVLGVPGWCKGNDEATFYEDGAVFRPARGAAANSSWG